MSDDGLVFRIYEEFLDSIIRQLDFLSKLFEETWQISKWTCFTLLAIKETQNHNKRFLYTHLYIKTAVSSVGEHGEKLEFSWEGKMVQPL